MNRIEAAAWQRFIEKINQILETLISLQNDSGQMRGLQDVRQLQKIRIIARTDNMDTLISRIKHEFSLQIRSTYTG